MKISVVEGEVTSFQTLKKNWEFTKIFNSKQRVNTKYVSLLSLPSEVYRIGISVPKRFAKAVVRNFNKRQIKNVIRNNNLFLEKHQGVLIVRSAFIELSFKQKEFEIKKIFKIWHDKKNKHTNPKL